MQYPSRQTHASRPFHHTLRALTLGLLAASVSLAGNAALHDQQPYTVEANANGFIVDGEYKLLRGGSLQWFRLPPEAWRDRLAKFKAAGFNTIDLYVPWNVIEPEEGQFNFTQPNLGEFLALAQDYGLYVYFRPGPYITNEMDGGGVPGWLMTKTTKKSTQADGKVNLRTDDPDYLFYVKRFLSKLNTHIKPFLASQGGPIVLYSLENEYNWFETFHEVDKLFWFEGGPERNPLAKFPTASYFTALRDQLWADGIDVPLTTCPGDGKASATGDVAGIIPMPNVYNGLGGEHPEKVVWDLLSDMHNPHRHEGNYVNFPTGTTETDRDPARIKRMMMGGMDGTFAFNVVGMHQEGYLNSVVLDVNGDTFNKVFDFSKLENILTGYLSPTVGYFHNVIDYNGAISPSGLLRDKFYDFRRDNLFFDAVEPWFAPAGKAIRSGKVANADNRLTIENPNLGAQEGKDRVHYWQDAGNGTRFISLVNGSGETQSIEVQGIRLEDLSFPRYTSLTVPVLGDQGPGQFGDTDTTSATILTTGLPLDAIGQLVYTTSELVALRQFNGETLLMVQGPEGAEGELQLDLNGRGYDVLSQGSHFQIYPDAADRLTLTYRYGAPEELRIQHANGEILRVVTVDSALAARSWFHSSNGVDVVLVGADYVDESSWQLSGQSLHVDAATEQSTTRLWLLSSEPVSLSSEWQVSRQSTQTGAGAGAPHWTAYHQSTPIALPALAPELLSEGYVRSDVTDALPHADTSTWQHWQGQPQSLESNDILRGHAWYRAELELTGWNWLPLWEPTDLWVEHASDIVGIYVNGTYLTTLAPMGTEIDGNLANATYQFPDLRPYLKKGKNVIAFRTEIWGHGSFMFPRGTLMGTQARMPAVGFDSEKGLFGQAKVGWRELKNWSVVPGLTGERFDYATTENLTEWQSAQAPSQLGKGDVLWYRTNFDAADLPNPADVLAPIALELTGKNAKATIYLNGRLIGRWLSDDTWLSRGFWGRAKRDMWMNTNPDHFPIAREMLRPTGQANQLAIVFEDTSGHKDARGGEIHSLKLVPAQENNLAPRVMQPLTISGQWQ